MQQAGRATVVHNQKNKVRGFTATQRALSNRSCGMLSGTLRISCITLPAFCRRSSSVFASPGFLANVQAPNRSRPATTAKEIFAYFIICASSRAIFSSFFVAVIILRAGGPRRLPDSQKVGGNFQARRQPNSLRR